MNRLIQAYERHARYLPAAADVLLVLGIAATAASLLWALVPTPQSAQWRPAPAVAQSTAVPAPAQFRLEPLLDAQLFGAYQADPEADLANAPETRLDLKLLGILAGEGPDDSRALIGGGSSEEKPFAIGDEIATATTLEAIYPDRVVLMRRGKAETLRLNKDQPSSYTPPTPAAPANGSAANEVGATLASVREQIMQDPSKASQFIRVQPVTQDGHMRGYRIYPGHDRQLFAAVGLRPGDVVTAVNGIQLDNAQKALQMLNDLSRANSLVLTVDRSGQLQTVNVSIN